MRRRSTLSWAITACALVATTVVSAAPASAKSFCLGRKATKVGTNGNDTIIGTRKADVIVGLGGDDTIIGKGGNDRICGGDGNDAMFGQGGTDLLAGEGDGDQLSGGKGNDKIDGGPNLALGNADYVNYFPSTTPVTVNLGTGVANGEGTDRIKNVENVFGSTFADKIAGDASTNLIQPLGGDDEVHAGGGLDLVFDGTGADTPAADGNDVIDGGDGPDAVHYGLAPGAVTVDLAAHTAAGDGNDQITGIEGAFGSSSDDTLSGDEQRNLLLGGLGDDAIDGRGANDAAGYWFASGPVTADLATDSASGGDGNDTLTSIEGLLGSVLFGDTLRGDDANNLLDGDGADDQLFGMGGNDWITGGPGNDTIDGGAGDFDMADFSSAAFQGVSPSVDVDLSTGTASGQGDDALSGIEAVNGSEQGDLLAGDAAGNIFFGRDGDDEIGAAGGDDKIDGGNGTDSADAGEGDDRCRNVESAEACEHENAQDIQSHPIESDAADIALYRRNF